MAACNIENILSNDEIKFILTNNITVAENLADSTYFVIYSQDYTNTNPTTESINIDNVHYDSIYLKGKCVAEGYGHSNKNIRDWLENLPNNFEQYVKDVTGDTTTQETVTNLNIVSVDNSLINISDSNGVTICKGMLTATKTNNDTKISFTYNDFIVISDLELKIDGTPITTDIGKNITENHTITVTFNIKGYIGTNAVITLYDTKNISKLAEITITPNEIKPTSTIQKTISASSTLKSINKYSINAKGIEYSINHTVYGIYPIYYTESDETNLTTIENTYNKYTEYSTLDGLSLQFNPSKSVAEYLYVFIPEAYKNSVNIIHYESNMNGGWKPFDGTAINYGNTNYTVFKTINKFIGSNVSINWYIKLLN